MYANLDFTLISCNQNSPASLRLYAVKAFEKAMNRGRLARFWARLLGQPAELASLKNLTVSNQRRPSRTVIVPIRQIQGSQGRTTDFDRSFHPLQQHIRERWISVAMAVLAHTPLPAVDLVQVGDVYFVQDGHHRISVAQAFQQDTIEARIVNA